MAETVVWNKKLLLISLLLGVVAVGLFYFYDSIQEKRIRGEIVEVLRWRQNMKAGDRIDSRSVEVLPISAGSASLDGVARKGDLATVVVNGTLVKNVEKNHFVFYTEILGHRGGRPSQKIAKRSRAFPLSVDPKYSVGALLSQGDRVDVLGVLSIGGKPPKTYTLIENLKVLGIGGRSKSPDEDFEADWKPTGVRVYRTVSVEVTPQVGEQLADLLARVRGRILLLVRNPEDTDAKFNERINPAVLPVLNTPLPDG